MNEHRNALRCISTVTCYKAGHTTDGIVYVWDGIVPSRKNIKISSQANKCHEKKAETAKHILYECIVLANILKWPLKNLLFDQKVFYLCEKKEKATKLIL